jgi:RES domain
LAFCRSLAIQTRFFNQQASDHLASVFADIHTLKTRKGQPLIVRAGAGTPIVELHRARVFHNECDVGPALARPDLHLGPPPPHVAASGRMNARGVSVFYGATDPKVALAEVRPPVGSFVVVARFEIIRPIQLLDLNALSAVHIEGSIFDADYASRLAKAEFLRSLTARISMPVMPDDEAMDYLPTQAVADFLASRSNEPIDGIIFPSVQTGAGLNLVLFHKASSVEPLVMPPGTVVDVSLGHFNDEGWEPVYTVFEKVPAAVQPPPVSPPKDFGFPVMAEVPVAQPASETDFREPTLRVLPKSLQVHLIRAVTIQSEPHRVSRHRIEKQASGDF